MELLPITFAANETKQFAKAGRYFEIIDSTSAVAIQFTGTGGNISDSISGALSGLFLEDPFTHFSVTNGAIAQTVTLLIMETGRGGSRRQPGNVRVMDEIGAAVVTVGPPLPMAITAFATTQILAPAANLAGCLIRSASIGVQAGAGGTVNLRLIAAPSAPTLLLGSFFTLMAIGSNGTNYSETSLWDLKKRIPAGWGLYAGYIISGAVAGNSGVIASYELQ